MEDSFFRVHGQSEAIRSDRQRQEDHYGGRMSISRYVKYGKYWAVYEDNELVCVTVYKKGAVEVARRLFRQRVKEVQYERSEAIA